MINPQVLYENPIDLLILQILFFHIRSSFFFSLFSTFPCKATGSGNFSGYRDQSACEFGFLTFPFHGNCLSCSSKSYYCRQYFFLHDSHILSIICVPILTYPRHFCKHYPQSGKYPQSAFDQLSIPNLPKLFYKQRSFFVT